MPATALKAPALLPSPVSAGVKQIWYPLQPAYNASHTGPLWVDTNWQVVVKASATAAGLKSAIRSLRGFPPFSAVNLLSSTPFAQ
jgi:hypothetical protein